MDMPKDPLPDMPRQHEAGLRRVRFATFESLHADGYDVQFFEDGATPLALNRYTGHNIPENWKRNIPTIVPKIATLRDSSLLMDGSAILRNGLYCFFDPVFTEPAWMQNAHQHRAIQSIDIETDEAVISEFPRGGDAISVSGRCFSARFNRPENFGHFIHDVLSRIYYEHLGVIVPGRDKVIAPYFRYPLQKVLFEMVFDGYEIVYAPPEKTIIVEELLLPANLCKAWPFNPAGIAALSKRMQQVLVPYHGSEKYKVCVSRSDGRKNDNLGRNFVNEGIYEARMQEMGFRIVEVSALDPHAQLSLWANTIEMVGIHGAGMMNMIMMPRDGKSIYTEIFGGRESSEENFERRFLQTGRCALAAGHRINLLASGLDQESRPIIDIERLESLLRNH